MIPFYRAFEEKHRGSRDVIKQRLRVYLPFVGPLKSLYEDLPALDIGCGRGEWVEILQEEGFQAKGVDLDEGMLEACRSMNLDAEKAEALSYLEAMPSESLVLLTGFHIAEHIPFDDLKKLVAEAHRVLKPGGLLIFETPNAENLIVGTQNFYLDPTHMRPIPYMLLEFLMEYSGFFRSKLLRLQENAELDNSKSLVLMDVLGGVSPDYAVVAQKKSDDVELDDLNIAFDAEYGLALSTLAERYDSLLLQRGLDLKESLNERETNDLSFSESLDILAAKEVNFASRVDVLESREILFSERIRALEHKEEYFSQQLDLQTNRESFFSERMESLENKEALFAARMELLENRTNIFSQRVESSESKLDHLSRGLEQATARYEESLFQQAAEASKQSENDRKAILLGKIQQLNDLNKSLQDLLNDSLGNAHDWYVRAESRLEDLTNTTQNAKDFEEKYDRLFADHQQTFSELEAMRKISQKMKSPSYILSNTIKSIIFSPYRVMKKSVRSTLKAAIKNTLKNPSVSRRLKKYLQRHPNLYLRLKNVAIHDPALVANPVPEPTTALGHAVVTEISSCVSSIDVSPAPEHLTENAKKLYTKLNSTDHLRDF